MRSKNTPRAKRENDNIFLRKLFCGHCGYTMARCRNYNKKRMPVYICNSRHSYGKSACVPVSISEGALKTEVLELLRKQAEVFAGRRTRQTKTDNGNIQTELAQTRQELNRAGGFLKGLYESLVSGDLTKTEYADMKRSYENRITGLNERERLLNDKIRECYMHESVLRKTCENLDNISISGRLTAETVNALIEKIFIFDDKRIEVIFKFTDETVGTEGSGNEQMHYC